jgi:siroheme synthase
MEYLKLKAARLIKDAEVIVYDDLGTGEALGLASDSCEKIYVGKRGGR